MPPPVTLAIALDPDRTVGRSTIDLEIVADLVVPTGRIVACDPTTGDYAPFLETFPRGTFPVILTSVRRLGDSTPTDVLAATVRFRSTRVATWTLARTRLGPADDEEGYGVDGGLGCFVDASVAARIDARAILADRRRHALVLDAATRANVVWFSSGAGDGVYATWIGRDDDGAIAALTTDFLLEQLLPFVERGPWGDGEEGSLLELLDFVSTFGRPSDAWCARSLAPGVLDGLWAKCGYGSTLLAALGPGPSPAHDAARSAGLATLDALIARFDLADARAARASLRSVPPADPEDALDDVSGAVLEAIHEARAAHGAATVRTFAETLAAREADAIRAVVPSAPTLDAIVDAHGIGRRRQVLRRRLTVRFGSLSPAQRARIESASAPEVETWIARAWDVASIDDALGDQKR